MVCIEQMLDEKYYCTICEHYHYKKLGKIYKKHIKYSNKNLIKKTSLDKVKNEIPDDKILDFDTKKLRPIARRQLNRLLNKLRYKKKQELYIWEINRLLLHEQAI